MLLNSCRLPHYLLGCLFLSALFLANTNLSAEQPAENRYPSGHTEAGLPVSNLPGRYYHADQNHALNQLHQLLFLGEVTPVELNGTLPRELAAGTDAERPWYFRRREGKETDRRLFGGDVRVSPLLSWPNEKTASLLKLTSKLLSETDSNSLKQLPSLQKLLFQWDVLSVWWRLEQEAETPPEVLFALAQLIRETSQPAETFKTLPSGWKEAREKYTPLSTPAAFSTYFSPDDLLSENSGWVELSRRSTKLFMSPQSMRASRVFLKLSDQTDLKDWITRQQSTQNSENNRPAEQIETAMLLSLIGISPELEAVATPVIDEIRFRTVFSQDDAVNLEETTSRDGSTMWIYLIDREKTRLAKSPAYRFISPDSQAIFPEYGTAKHATYAAQCTLCHRLTNSGNQALAGIRSLSTVAGAQIIHDPEARKKLAELQMTIVTNRLKLRLEKGPVALEPAAFNLREIPRELPKASVSSR